MLNSNRVFHQKKATASISFYLILIIYALVTIFPLVWLFYTSLKTNNEVFMNPWALPANPQFKNYIEAWNVAKMSLYMKNSILISIACILLTLCVCTLAAYGIARFNTKVSKFAYSYFILGIMVPVHAVLIPLYVLMSRLKLINSPLALVATYTTFAIPISIFILCASLVVIPNQLEEAAVIDGCNILQVFWHIILPVVKPALSTIVILNFLSFWNEYIFAMIFTSKDSIRTLPVGLANFSGRYGINYSVMAAGMMIAIIPSITIYIIMQEKVISGMTAGAVKG